MSHSVGTPPVVVGDHESEFDRKRPHACLKSNGDRGVKHRSAAGLLTITTLLKYMNLSGRELFVFNVVNRLEVRSTHARKKCRPKG